MTEDKKPISSEEMIVKIASILKNGMILGEMTDEEKKTYQANLISFLSQSPFYAAFYDHDTNTIMVETTYFDPLICVDITNNGIYFLPLTDKGYYQAFMKIMEFVMIERKKSKEIEEQQEEKKETKEMPNFDFL